MFTALSLKNKQPNNFIQIKKKIFIVFKKKRQFRKQTKRQGDECWQDI